MFAPGKPFQPSLMFSGVRPGAYPRVEHLKLYLITKIRKLRTEKVLLTLAQDTTEKSIHICYTISIKLIEGSVAYNLSFIQ